MIKWYLFISTDFNDCRINIVELTRLLSEAYPGNSSILRLKETRQDLGIVVSVGRSEYAGVERVMELIDLLRAKSAGG